MKAISILAELAAAGLVTAEDHLYSKRLNKRFIDGDGHFNMSFFHVNDVHAHLDQFTSGGSDCEDASEGCYGGYARIKTTVDKLRDEYPDHLWLNAGDEFQGTLFYTYYGGSKISIVLNELKFDAMTLGNHEWDGGDDKLGDFLVNLTFPIIDCNVHSENEKLNKTIKPYHIFEDYDVAIIGATTDTTPAISNVGNTTIFTDPIEEIQKTIWEIRNTTDIKRIIALTHIGYDVDQKLAAQTEGLSLIIGGHSHTLLGNDIPDAEGKYPTIVEDLNGDEVFIVTAYRWGEYLGSIDITFDKDGKALAYHGAPIHMDNSTKLDPELQAQITKWRGPFEEYSAQVIGTTNMDLDQETCQDGDCLLGEVMTDAMLYYVQNQVKNASQSSASSASTRQPDFAMMNAGGIRATIAKGNITRGEVLTSFPFGNAVVEVSYSGSDLRKVLEGAVSQVSQFNGKELDSWIQVSRGIQVEYDATAEKGSRLRKVTIGGKPLEEDKKYNMVTVDFVARGGDNILPESKDFATLDTLDQVLTRYIQDRSPLTPTLEDRLKQVNGTSAGDEDGDDNGSGGDSGDGGDSADGGNGGSPKGDAGTKQVSLWMTRLLAMVWTLWMM